jgi:hypothetical protein
MFVSESGRVTVQEGSGGVVCGCAVSVDKGMTKLVIGFFGCRMTDCREELVVRFGADCFAKHPKVARWLAVWMGNLRQEKPGRIWDDRKTNAIGQWDRCPPD